MAIVVIAVEVVVVGVMVVIVLVAVVIVVKSWPRLENTDWGPQPRPGLVNAI